MLLYQCANLLWPYHTHKPENGAHRIQRASHEAYDMICDCVLCHEIWTVICELVSCSAQLSRMVFHVSELLNVKLLRFTVALRSFT